MSTNPTARISLQKGISLIELIMFILIVSIALVALLRVMNVTSKSSSDPLIHKQALAIAESMLEEVELMPFTFCDPDDPSAVTATSAVVGGTGCAVRVESSVPDTAFAPYQTATETRYALASQFDNVYDYHGFGMPSGSIYNVASAPTGVNGYTLNAISVTPTALAAMPGGEAVQIRVSVTGPDNVEVILDGIRTRYSPRAVP